MSAKDVSRYLFQPLKRYSGVRFQQGRVITDADLSEMDRIDNEGERRDNLAIIGTKGTCDAGFSIPDERPTAPALPEVRAKSSDESYAFLSGSFTFAITPGIYYIGGHRFEIGESICAPDGVFTPQDYAHQDDWVSWGIHPPELAKENPFIPDEYVKDERFRINPSEHLYPPIGPNLGLDDQEIPEEGQVHKRFDLVYLHAWEQCITEVEDSELKEVALGGPDTSVRVRRMQRVKIVRDIDCDTESCSALFDQLKLRLRSNRDEPWLITDLAAPDLDICGVFDDKDCSLKSSIKMTVEQVDDKIDDDPCTPDIIGGYIGADNAAIRIQMTGPKSFIWGMDNAAPLYRAVFESLVENDTDAGGPLVTLRLLTPPRDQESQPLDRQAMEILPWGAVLDNREKVAERTGDLFTIYSYDPATSRVVLRIGGTSSEPLYKRVDELMKFMGENSEASRRFVNVRDGDQAKYVYLRLWTGGSGDYDAPDYQTMNGNARVETQLRGTGLKVTFCGCGYKGDYWVISARPQVDWLDQLTPWELIEAAPPMGPKDYFAPIGVINWKTEGKPYDEQAGAPGAGTEPPTEFHPWVEGEGAWDDAGTRITDCRTLFPKLTELNGCCTVTVGDGVHSSGHTNDLATAIATLPPEGGRICLLPGIHEAPDRHTYAGSTMKMEGRRNVIIEGCGADSIVRSAWYEGAKPAPTSIGEDELPPPLFAICNSTNITLSNFYIQTWNQVAVQVQGDGYFGNGVTLEKLVVYTSGDRVPDSNEENTGDDRVFGSRPAVLSFDVVNLEVDDCWLVADQRSFNMEPLCVLGGTELKVHDSFIEVGSEPSDRVQGAPACAGAPRHRPNALLPMGGIQIMSRSTNVNLKDNTILYGRGGGITLGHAVRGAIYQVIDNKGPWDAHYHVYPDNKERPIALGSMMASNDEDISHETVFSSESALALSDAWGAEPVLPDDIESVVAKEHALLPAGDVCDLRIEGNTIRHMGRSGITTAMFFDQISTRILETPFEDNPQPLQRHAELSIGLVDATIENNVLEHNTGANYYQPDGDFLLRGWNSYLGGVGGITLASGIEVTIRGNEISGHMGGSSGMRVWVCGILVRDSVHVRVEGNRIVNNGVQSDLQTSGAGVPLRGGIVLTVAEGGVVVRDNHVSHRGGRALWVWGQEPDEIDDPMHSTRSSSSTHCPEVIIGRVHAIIESNHFENAFAEHLVNFESPDVQIYSFPSDEYTTASGVTVDVEIFDRFWTQNLETAPDVLKHTGGIQFAHNVVKLVDGQGTENHSVMAHLRTPSVARVHDNHVRMNLVTTGDRFIGLFVEGHYVNVSHNECMASGQRSHRQDSCWIGLAAVPYYRANENPGQSENLTDDDFPVDFANTVAFNQTNVELYFWGPDLTNDDGEVVQQRRYGEGTNHATTFLSERKRILPRVVDFGVDGAVAWATCPPYT